MSVRRKDVHDQTVFVRDSGGCDDFRNVISARLENWEYFDDYI